MRLKSNLRDRLVGLLAATAINAVVACAVGQTFTTLHSFGTVSGNAPEAPLIQGPDGRLYGTAYNGGAYAGGTVFAVNTNGTGFTVLHSFTGTNDGANPRGGLILSGTALYGTASGGGTNLEGTVFTLNTDGSGFSVLHTFSTDDLSTGFTNSDGANPFATLILSGNTLYGTTGNGGIYGEGTVFAVNTNGGGFVSLHAFGSDFDDYTLTDSDGASPNAALILSGGILYGTTSGGGTNASGTIFETKTDGTAFATLYTFTGGVDGAHPEAALTLSGNTLYGTTHAGTTNSQGTVFAIKADGTGFKTLHTFSSLLSSNVTGASPRASLIISGNRLYGTTPAGGEPYPDVAGTVFALNTDGSGFTILHNFDGGTNGSEPQAALILSGDILYGTSGSYGGISDDNGTVFTLDTNGANFTILYSFLPVVIGDVSSINGTYVNSDGMNPKAALVSSDGTLFGTTPIGGLYDCGTLFSVKTNGTDFTTLYSFQFSVGTGPTALVLSGNTLFGITTRGGTNGNGVIFKINTDGSGFAVVYTFTAMSYNSSYYADTNTDGAWPNSLILSGETLYGSSESGGPRGSGTIFSVSTNGTQFTLLHGFEGGIFIDNDGANPNPGLVLSSNVLFDTTMWGGSGNAGTVFAINTDGTGFASLYNFTAIDEVYGDTNSDGAEPYAGLALSGETLYGTTSIGGANASGTIYKINSDGSGFAVLHTFASLQSITNVDGGYPQAGLAISGNLLYGTTTGGGAFGNGTLFILDTNGTGFNALHNFSSQAYAYTLEGTYYSTEMFTNNDGSLPQANVLLSSNALYCTTQYGGEFGGGVAFSLSLPFYPVAYQTLLVAPAPFSQAMGISGGNIVGCSFYENSDDTGFLYNGTSYSSLLDPNAVGFSGSSGASGPDGYLFGGTFPAGISGGTIVGYYTDTNASVHGFLYSDGAYTTLDDPDASGWTYAQGVDAGTIVGSYLGSDLAYHGFIYSNGVYKALNDPNAHSSTFASGISGANIVGWYDDADGIPHGFLYDGNSFTTLDEPDAVSGTYVCGISGGNIVGYYFGPGGTAHGFLYSGGAYTTLDIPGAGTGAFQGTYIHGISGNTIVGWYLNGDGSYGFAATVSIAPKNPMSIKGISFAGANVVLNGINGVVDTTNYVLTSTNLLLPFDQWTRVATNILQTGGNFSITVTNAFTSDDPQRFYILQSP